MKQIQQEPLQANKHYHHNSYTQKIKDKIIQHDDETFVINIAVMQEKKIYKEAHSQQ